MTAGSDETERKVWNLRGRNIGVKNIAATEVLLADVPKLAVRAWRHSLLQWNTRFLQLGFK